LLLCGAALCLRLAFDAHKRDDRRATVGWTFLVLAVCEIAFLDVVRRPLNVDLSLVPFEGGAPGLYSLRYYIAPVFWFASALALWADTTLTTKQSVPALILTVAIGATTLACFSDSYVPRSDVSWRIAVANARTVCRRDAIPITEVRISGGWPMLLPCSHLVSASTRTR